MVDRRLQANLTTTGSNSSAPPPPPPAGQPPPPAAPGEILDNTINGFTTGTLATSGNLAPFQGYGFGSAPPAGYPPLALTDKVMKELDRNICKIPTSEFIRNPHLS